MYNPPGFKSNRLMRRRRLGMPAEFDKNFRDDKSEDRPRFREGQLHFFLIGWTVTELDQSQRTTLKTNPLLLSPKQKNRGGGAAAVVLQS